jgi:hypothetical protein
MPDNGQCHTPYKNCIKPVQCFQLRHICLSAFANFTQTFLEQIYLTSDLRFNSNQVSIMFRHLGLWYEKRTNLQTQTTLDGLSSWFLSKTKTNLQKLLGTPKSLASIGSQSMGGEGLEPPTTSV